MPDGRAATGAVEPREVLFVAGDPSGEAHAAEVARELTARCPSLRLVGVGGDRMRAAGVELLQHSGDLAVMGFVGVVKVIPRLRGLLARLRARLESGSVAAVVLVDYGGFNLGYVAGAAKAAGVPVLYYITPQVWASRPGRLRTLARTVTKAAVILPFEEPLLREHGIDATFVGHPLIDLAQGLPDRDEARRSIGVDPERPLLALFPGSRRQELARHLAPFVETARELQRRLPSLQVVVSGAPGVDIDPSICPVPVVREMSFPVLRAADAALCKSGTTTLEAAVAGCPLVLAYRTGAIDYAVAKRLVTIPHIGLVNVVAGRELAREFVQDALQPAAVADALEPLLARDSAVRREMVDGLAAVRASLGSPGAARRVAALAATLARCDANVAGAA